MIGYFVVEWLYLCSEMVSMEKPLLAFYYKKTYNSIRVHKISEPSHYKTIRECDMLMTYVIQNLYRRT
jgi:hypothetical protein